MKGSLVSMGMLSLLWGNPVLSAPQVPDPQVQPFVQQYLDRLASRGYTRGEQGVWLQSGQTLLAESQGQVPLPAASLTKVATTLAVLKHFGPDHRFPTLLSATGGPIQAGVLQGDLVIQGGEDPLFVWEDAFALGTLLQDLGIHTVAGDVVVVGPFFMNFYTDPQTTGGLFRQAIDANRWPEEAANQFQTLPPGTPRPQVQVRGQVRVAAAPIPEARPLIRHESLPLVELAKRMNRYSNNLMADILAQAVGGPDRVAQIAAEVTGLPRSEIQLINGSGLGVENRLSPRAACALMIGIQELLKPNGLTVGDTFEIVGVDEGVLERRVLPPLFVAKSGTLNQVSALAGALPTREGGVIWFAILNGTADLGGARTEQGNLLQTLRNQWGTISALPAEITPKADRSLLLPRNLVLLP